MASLGNCFLCRKLKTGSEKEHSQHRMKFPHDINLRAGNHRANGRYQAVTLTDPGEASLSKMRRLIQAEEAQLHLNED